MLNSFCCSSEYINHKKKTFLAQNIYAEVFHILDFKFFKEDITYYSSFLILFKFL